jgi:hypothetical protein
MASAGGLSFQAIGLIDKGMASLPVSLTATALLVSETKKKKKLTLGEKTSVQVPHSVVTLMKYKRWYWLTNARMVKYQSVRCENPQVKLKAVQTLNLATLLPSAMGAPRP